MNTGTIIRLLRIADGISQTDFADRIGVSRTYLSQVENSKRNPGISFLRQISSIFDIPVALLIIDEADKTKAIYKELRDLLVKTLSIRLTLQQENLFKSDEDDAEA